jgi:2-polyprenyl-3-methyl-5-hydroxy-6-metoxy-1,4-benzoquinol methylase
VTPGARPRATAPQEHYSYTVYADPAVADRFEQVRFGGPIGALLAEAQEAVLLDFVGPLAGRAVLDVGTGTGRAALALAAQGAAVTGVDASTEMLRVARDRAEARGLAISFTPGDAHALPFAAASFDVAVCLRVVMHTPDWRRCVGELCRVARHRVVLDYPALLSAAAFQSLGRRAAAAVGASVEAYRVLPERAVRRELARHGFRVAAVHRQFVLPIALHKRLGSRRATERIEAALARAGLLRVLGSPVTVMAER